MSQTGASPHCHHSSFIYHFPLTITLVICKIMTDFSSFRPFSCFSTEVTNSIPDVLVCFLSEHFWYLTAVQIIFSTQVEAVFFPVFLLDFWILSYPEAWWCSPPPPCLYWASRWTSGRLWRTHLPGMRAAVSGMKCTPCRWRDLEQNIPLWLIIIKKKTLPETRNSACFQLPTTQRKTRTTSCTVSPRVRPLCANSRLLNGEKLVDLETLLADLESCCVHGERRRRRLDSTGLCASCSARSEAGCSLGRFTPAHPPLIIPVCPPIAASAYTSHSHCPTATLLPVSQLNTLTAFPFSCQRSRILRQCGCTGPMWDFYDCLYSGDDRRKWQTYGSENVILCCHCAIQRKSRPKDPPPPTTNPECQQQRFSRRCFSKMELFDN